MTATDIHPPKFLILVEAGFDEMTFARAQRALYAAGAELHTGSLQSGLVQSKNGDQLGHRYLVDAVLGSIDSSQYDAVIIPGGESSVESLSGASAVRDLLTDVYAANKPVLALGSGAQVLAACGLSPVREASGAVVAGRGSVSPLLDELIEGRAAA